MTFSVDLAEEFWHSFWSGFFTLPVEMQNNMLQELVAETVSRLITCPMMLEEEFEDLALSVLESNVTFVVRAQ